MTQAITVHTTFDVDDAETTRRVAQVLKHKGGLFPADMTEAQAAALARLSLLYRLDLMANELSLFQGRPYLTLLGAVRVANEHEKFRGMSCEPATAAEREAFRARDDEELWIARVYRSDRDVPTVGYGRASRTDDQPVARRWTQEQAQARAKRRALRDAFSLPVPGLEEPAGLDQDAEPEPASIRPEQTKAIHAASRRAGYSADGYRQRLREMFGRQSSQELTAAEAQAAIAAFAAEAEPTAEERVAARANDPDERSFYAELDAASDASGDEEPRFFTPAQPNALADARERLRARAHAQQLTGPQIDGLLEHSFGRGVTLATCTIDQAHQALELLPADEEQEAPLL